jgi:hypothetical protein
MYKITVLANHSSLLGSLKKGDVLTVEALPADLLLNEKAGFVKIETVEAREEVIKKAQEPKKSNSK